MSILKYDGSAAALTSAPARDLSGAPAADTLTGTAGARRLLGRRKRPDGRRRRRRHLLPAGPQDPGGRGWPAQGVDRIVAWQNVYLGDHPAVENLTVGNDKIYGAGNAPRQRHRGPGRRPAALRRPGQDVLIGGAGADVFIVVKGEGNDVVQDFASGEDKVRLKAGFTSFEQVKAAMTQVGAT